MTRMWYGLTLLLLSAPAHAQVADASAKLGWDQVAPTLAVASGYTYRSYADGSVTGTAMTGVVCTGAASPYVCTAPFPAFTPGAHTIALTAGTLAGATSIESAKSAPLAFTFVVVPGAPASLRIVIP